MSDHTEYRKVPFSHAAGGNLYVSREGVVRKKFESGEVERGRRDPVVTKNGSVCVSVKGSYVCVDDIVDCVWKGGECTWGGRETLLPPRLESLLRRLEGGERLGPHSPEREWSLLSSLLSTQSHSPSFPTLLSAAEESVDPCLMGYVRRCCEEETSFLKGRLTDLKEEVVRRQCPSCYGMTDRLLFAQIRVSRQVVSASSPQHP
jgi:hypothetical protein